MYYSFHNFLQTPESDVEEIKANSNVSFGEFLKQYKEISDWLKNIQTALQQKAAAYTLALSEKYLNQVGKLARLCFKVVWCRWRLKFDAGLTWSHSFSVMNRSCTKLILRQLVLGRYRFWLAIVYNLNVAIISSQFCCVL